MHETWTWDDISAAVAHLFTNVFFQLPEGWREKKVVMWFVNYLILFFEYHIVHVSYGTPKPEMVDG